MKKSDPQASWQGRCELMIHCRRLAMVLMPFALQACAQVVYIDGANHRSVIGHVVGLVWLTMEPGATAEYAGESLRTRSFGLSFTNSEAGSALALGYNDATLAFVRDNRMVSASALQLGHVPIERAQP